MGKKMIIKGVGTFMAKRYNPELNGTEVITLGSLQDLQIEMNTEIEDVFGGDGLFAIDTLVTNKNIEITATDAYFDLQAISLMMGATVQNQVESYVWSLNEGHMLDDNAEATVKFGDTIFGDGDFQVRLSEDNVLLKRNNTATDQSELDSDEYMVDINTGKITLHDSNKGKGISVSYKRKETVDMTDLISDEVPCPVHVIHHGSFVQKDGTYQGIETEFYSCRAHGSFTIDAQRATASASTVQLRVLDPERADKKLGSIKRYSAPGVC